MYYMLDENKIRNVQFTLSNNKLTERFWYKVSIWAHHKHPIIYSLEEAVAQCVPVQWAQALGPALDHDQWAQLVVADPQAQGGQVRLLSIVFRSFSLTRQIS